MTVTIHHDYDIKIYRYVDKIEQHNNYIILYKGYRLIIPLRTINKIDINI